MHDSCEHAEQVLKSQRTELSCVFETQMRQNMCFLDAREHAVKLKRSF